MTKSKYKSLVNNSITFAIGNIGSKLVSFALLPLYTHMLNESEYGTVDLLLTICTICLPIISLNVSDAILRFLLKKDHEQEVIASSSFFISCLMSTSLIIIASIFFAITSDEIIKLLVPILVVQIFQNLYAQYARGIGLVKEFSLNGIIMSLSMVFFNLIFLVTFRGGMLGYILAIVLSNIVSIIYFEIVTKLISIVKIKNIDLRFIKEMLKYGLPLVPHSIMWSLINIGSKFFIVYYLSTASNGIFAVSSKIPSILNIAYSIFIQAWQISAFEEYDSEDNSIFYSTIFKYLSIFLLIAASGILVFLNPIMKLLVAPKFYIAWKYVPVLLLGTIFSCFSTYYGTIYTSFMKTNRLMLSSLTGGLLTILFSFILIKPLGIQGAALANMFGFLSMWIIRIVDTRKILKIKLNNKFILGVVTIIIQTIISININSYMGIGIQFFILILLLALYAKDLNAILKKLLKRT